MSHFRSVASKLWLTVMVVLVGYAVINTGVRVVSHVHDLALRRTVVDCIRRQQQATRSVWQPAWETKCQVRPMIRTERIPEPTVYATDSYGSAPWGGVWFGVDNLDGGGPELGNLVFDVGVPWVLVIGALGLGIWLRWLAKPAAAVAS